MKRSDKEILLERMAKINPDFKLNEESGYKGTQYVSANPISKDTESEEGIAWNIRNQIHGTLELVDKLITLGGNEYNPEVQGFYRELTKLEDMIGEISKKKHWV